LVAYLIGSVAMGNLFYVFVSIDNLPDNIYNVPPNYNVPLNFAHSSVYQNKSTLVSVKVFLKYR